MTRDFFKEFEDFNPKSLSGGMFSNYQDIAKTTAIYPKEIGLAYVALGLTGEAGEIANKIKKIYRDNLEVNDELKQTLSKEIGDCLWYISALCTELNLSLTDVANQNLEKLLDRKSRDKISGEGDTR
jgi:NTP pyrophosphatase (non-canonical NTP hydrolase)